MDNNLSPLDRGIGSPMSDDSFFLSALMNFDGFLDQPFSPLLTDPVTHQVLSNCSPFPSPNNSFIQSKDNLSSCDDTSQKTNLPFAPNSHSMDETWIQYNNSIVPRLVASTSLAERMLKALFLFKESSYSGILAQVWIPVRKGNEYVLSTSDQPFLLDQILAGYREISRNFSFLAKVGLPGRVFISGMPEWTSNVVYYKEPEYLRMEYAISHEVKGSLAVPVFELTEGSCVAVLELVTKREKSDFDSEMDSVCNALQAVNLKTTKTRDYQQFITPGQKSAFAEILDVVRVICHAHMLPLALTWVPIIPSGPSIKCMLRVHEPACYVNDPTMQEFLHACTEHPLEKGQGISGKAFESNHPFFSSDIKEYTIREYPLAHHARKFRLRAAVAIRLRSNLTGIDDYVLEFFLPVNCKGNEEQQLLLNSLSGTMQRICKSLRTVSESEIGSEGPGCKINDLMGNSCEEMDRGNVVISQAGFQAAEERAEDVMHEKVQSGSIRYGVRKRTTAEKNISLSVLQKYFSGSLKDAAKSLGVCPTTLKRICRQHSISRWPSRTINKVNRSLKKIQNVINLVHGMDGEPFKYDPSSGCLITTGTYQSGDNPSQFPKLKLQNLQNLNSVDQAVAPEPSHPSSSSMTDSSSGSASSHPTFNKNSRNTLSCNSPVVTVKATYKDDMVRFKFSPSAGCHQLFDEIGKRFKLSSGSFQLKYRDDEEDWVNLVNDSDLQECVDVMDSIGSWNVKLQVKDLVCVGGSSAGSSSVLMDL